MTNAVKYRTYVVEVKLQTMSAALVGKIKTCEMYQPFQPLFVQ